MSFPNAGEKDLLQAPGVAKPSISHLLPSRWAISSYLCTGYPKHASSSRMVPHRKGGPECRNTMPPSEISQAETQQLLSSHASPPNSAHTFHGPLGLPCADTTTDKFRLKKSINTSRRHQETTYTVQGGVGLPHARQPHRHSLADQLPVIQKSRHIWKKKKRELHPNFPAGKSSILWKTQPYPIWRDSCSSTLWSGYFSYRNQASWVGTSSHVPQLCFILQIYFYKQQKS